VRLRERRRHVEVGHPRSEAGVEDRRVEAGVGRVEDDVGAGLSHDGDDGFLAGRVDLRGREAVGLAERAHDGLRSGGIEVGQRDVVEERAALRDGGERRPDSAGTDDEDSHDNRSS
jgi:hypothetical protein